MTLHKEFWGLLFLGFVFWVMVASSPTGRIENGCRPVAWGGNVVTSMTALVLPKQQDTVQKWFDTLEYGCRYTVWRLFYQESFNKWKEAQGITGDSSVTLPAATLQELSNSGTAGPPKKPGDVAAPSTPEETTPSLTKNFKKQANDLSNSQ